MTLLFENIRNRLLRNFLLGGAKFFFRLIAYIASIAHLAS